MILLHYFSILLFLFHAISMLFLTFRLHYFHLRSTIILCVFIKTDDSRKETQLHRSSRSDGSFAGETSSTISVRLHGHENTKLPPPSSRSCIGETNRCFMNLQRMSRSVVSWNSALQTDPHWFAAICKPSVASLPYSRPHPLFSARKRSCAKFSSNKISEAIVARDVLGGVASP